MELVQKRRPLRAEIIRILVPVICTVALFAVTIFQIIIPFLEDNLMNKKREMVREMTNLAWGTIRVYHLREEAGEYSREEAQAAVIEHFRQLRYGSDQKDYFWINDIQPRIIMHPYRPDLDGKDVSRFADPSGKCLFSEMVEITKKQGEGFVDYMWQWKDDAQRIVPKISYVKLFEPWGWIVGTGIYIEDVRLEVAGVTKHVTILCSGILALILALSVWIVHQGIRTETKRALAEEDIRRLNMELEQLVDELKRSNTELEQFAYVASHDLQEPLRKVRSFSERLIDKYSENLDERGHDYLKRMSRAAARMQKMIEDLLSFSRVSSREDSFIPVDFQSVIQEVLSDLEIRIERTKARIEVDSLPVIESDPTQMHQLFENLINNALKFVDEGDQPFIRIFCRTSEDADDSNRNSVYEGADTGNIPDNRYCHIFIEDNGIGFDEKYFDRILQPFQRLHGMSHYEGTGIGLAICYKIVERHGGRLSARSERGKGSTFIVTLPFTHKTAEVYAQ